MPSYKKVSLISAGVAAVTTFLLMHNKDRIKDKAVEVAGDIKERSAMKLHRKIGFPVYDFLKKKNNIPF
jgi:hypothetical protein